ncbi:hypothetical protein WJX82_009855 [Trebouxia sp. C0006]
MSMYVRIKRSKTTIFLHVEPTDTILEVKQKLQELTQQGPETQRLYLGRTMLEDARQLAELKVENDDVIALTYQQGDGSWEDVNIAEYVPEMEITGHS